jgi:hypothetical protein
MTNPYPFAFEKMGISIFHPMNIPGVAPSLDVVI